MKTGKLTYHNFRGLDRRNTAGGVSPTGVPSDKGFEKMYGFIKEGVLHPLPKFIGIDNNADSACKFFKVNGSLYKMNTDGVEKRNGTSFVSFISYTFSSNPEYWDMKPFFEIASSLGTFTRASNTDQSITTTTAMDTNKYVNKHIIIGTAGNSQTLYVTGNDTNTIYTEGLINGTIMALSNTINFYDKQDIILIYDGDDIYRFTTSGSFISSAGTYFDAFIEIFANRLFILQNHKITFSCFNSATLANNPFNYIDVEGKIMDKMIIGSTLVVFTTNGTYGLTGTGFTTMNFPKISEFAPDTRIYPRNQTDNTYIIRKGYVRRFTIDGGLLDTQYNYPVIPDTQARIFAIERGIIFPLGHGSGGYGLINVEELQNRKLISITNRTADTVNDMIEFDGDIFMFKYGSGTNNIYKSSGFRNIFLQTNNIRFPDKVYRDTVQMSLGGNYPNSIYADIDSAGLNEHAKNSASNQVSYSIRKMGYSIKLEIDTDSIPLSSFTINYKY